MNNFILQFFPKNKIAFILFIGILTSCIPNSKLIFLNNSSQDPTLADGQIIPHQFPEYKLQYNDIISVDFKTSVDFINESFELSGSNQNMMMGAQNGGDIFYITGYKVDQNGEVNLPLLHQVKVLDLTIPEVEKLLETRLKQLINDDVFVRVKLGGIRFSSIGELNRPGKYTILQDRLTIFEALAHSGDLNTFANRKEVILIRQYPEGSKIIRVNLLDRDIIRTPYYFIQNNDQLYVQPLKQREFARNENASQNLFMLSSLVTTVLLLINLIK